MKASKVVLPFFVIFGLLLTGCGGDDDNENSAPTAVDAAFTIEADTALESSLQGVDEDPLTFAVATAPTHGTLTLAGNGTFTYQPDATFTGMDQFTFTVSDGMTTSDSATVNITINPLQVSFSTYSRKAFNQQPGDEPLPINSRAFTQDANGMTYDDLLMAN